LQAHPDSGHLVGTRALLWHAQRCQLYQSSILGNGGEIQIGFSCPREKEKRYCSLSLAWAAHGPERAEGHITRVAIPSRVTITTTLFLHVLLFCAYWSSKRRFIWLVPIGLGLLIGSATQIVLVDSEANFGEPENDAGLSVARRATLVTGPRIERSAGL
jgi:hypothetical protein